MNLGKMFKMLVMTLLFISLSLTIVPRLQIAQSSPDRTGLPTYWPSVYFCDGTAYSYNETFTGKVGDVITVALVVSNLTDNVFVDPENPTITYPLGNLDGFDVQVSWDPTVLKHINHTLTVPVEKYSNPIPPSPYAGILHEEAYRLMDVTDENDAIPNSEPGTMAWYSYAIMPGAALFNDNGTFFIMTFNVTKRGSSPLKLTNTDLSGEGGTLRAMKCHTFDGVFRTADAPMADLTFWPNIGVVDKPVIFNASASYSPEENVSISKYVWDFGDKNITTVNDPIITHAYNRSRTYTVSLVVEDSNGVRSSPKTEQVNVVSKRNLKVADVSLTPADLVLVNRTVDIEVRVENDAKDVDENCTMKAYYNATAVNWTDISTTNWIKIGEINTSISRDSFSIESLIWNTTGVPQADVYYYVLANATLVPYEDAKDNILTSMDPILITSTMLHDVAIKKFEFGWGDSFKHPVLDGETTKFQITVLNAGTESETAVNVTLYYNGSMLKNWTISMSYGNTTKLACTRLFEPGSYNITALATIKEDEHLDDNRKQGTLRIIETPKLNFTFEPKKPYVNQTVFLNASASFHAESTASITQYKWYIYDPGGIIVKTYSGPDLINITYQFGEDGQWQVVLSVQDSYNIVYTKDRPLTSAYQINARINVQPSPGFPLEYILVIIAIVVAVLAVLAAFIYRRRRRT